MSHGEPLSRLFEMLLELHERGYERLRLVPRLAPSGMHYRFSITSADNVRVANGARAVDASASATHSSANGLRAFGWDDSAKVDVTALADLFLLRFPEIAERGRGSDLAYAAWYRDVVMPAARSGAFPYAYADYALPAGTLPMTNGASPIVLPPPAEDDPALDGRATFGASRRVAADARRRARIAARRIRRATA